MGARSPRFRMENGREKEKGQKSFFPAPHLVDPAPGPGVAWVRCCGCVVLVMNGEWPPKYVRNPSEWTLPFRLRSVGA